MCNDKKIVKLWYIQFGNTIQQQKRKRYIYDGIKIISEKLKLQNNMH